MFSKFKQRGYTIVELALLLAVVGIMLSGIIIPYTAQYKSRLYSDANNDMNEIIDAIVGYAIVNRSPGAMLFYGNFEEIDELSYYGSNYLWIPANRPFLPCPARNTNGIEARKPIVAPFSPHDNVNNEIDNAYQMRAKSNNTSTTAPHYLRNLVVYRNIPELDQDWQGNFDSSNPQPGSINDTNPLGNCELSSGYLPWRTLGLNRPTDRWGNDYTYVVSDAFSTGLYGFDQTTRSYMFNQFTEANVQFYDPRRLNRGIFLSNRANPATNFSPIILCDPTQAFSSSVRAACNHTNQIDVSANPNDDNTGFTSYPHASMYIPNALMSPEPRRNLDGLPFVVISAGQNKRGGFVDSAGNCLESTFGSLSNDTANTSPELTNATYHIDCIAKLSNITGTNLYHGFGTGGLVEAHNINIDSTVIDTDSTRRPAYYRFAYGIGRPNIKPWEPRPSEIEITQGNQTRDFDDVVGWLTRRELIQRLKDAGILPIKDTYEGMLLGQSYYYLD